MNIQKFVQITKMLSLFHFKLGQQLQEPFKSFLLPIDPNKIDFLQIESCLWAESIWPFIVAVGAGVFGFPVPMHYRLKDWGEWRYSDPGGHQHCVLRLEYCAGGSSVRPVKIHFQWRPLPRMGRLGSVDKCCWWTVQRCQMLLGIFVRDVIIWFYEKDLFSNLTLLLLT